MSKKILEEGTIRKFMKLANIEALTGGFVEKLNENAEDKVELEEKAEELEEKTEELDEMGMAYDAHEDDEGGEDLGDLEMDEPADEPADEAGEVSLSPEEAELLKGVLEKLLGAMDEEEAAAEEEPELDMEPEMDMEEPADEEMPLEEEVEELEEETEDLEEGDKEEGDKEEAEKGKGKVSMEEALVKRIAAKVAARLLDAKK